jgi:hypothetical protein
VRLKLRNRALLIQCFSACTLIRLSPLDVSIPKSTATADVRIGLLAKGLINAFDADQVWKDAVQTLQLAVQEPPKNFTYERAAPRVAAVEWIIQSRPPANRSVPGRRMDGSVEWINSQKYDLSPSAPEDEMQSEQTTEADRPGSNAPEGQWPRESHKPKNPVRRNERYERIDKALREFAATRPKSHQEVFRLLDDRKVAIPNRKPFKAAGGWLKGFQRDPHAASSWLSQAWGRLGLPAFARGPKK